MSYRILSALAVSALVGAPAMAAEPVQFDWNLRLRHESVDDAAFGQDANADTLRLRAALRAALGRGWSFQLEGEGIANAGDDYNSGANGRTTYPAITDPSGAEINQAWLGWKGAKASATIGRQRILLDNQRFVGNSGWRQNEQTFDALSVSATPIDGLELRYAWLDRVHRVAGDNALDPLARERDLSTHLLNAAFKRGAQQWIAYVYLHHDLDLASASAATYGLRWIGTHPAATVKWGWTVEAARQVDYSDNPLSFAHDYWLLEPSLQAHGLTWKLGWEHLGGNGAHALQTPLASLHAFNGWADKFLVTPVGGLEDAYLSASAKAGKLTWVAAAHDYRADRGSQHYGREWDLSLSLPLRAGWNGMIKVADYQADSFARDTRKLWLQLEYVGTLPRAPG
jgi:hypothetical protein